MRWTIKLKAYIDLGVIRQNISDVRAQTSVKLLLMVKADAYGHGLSEVARAVQDDVDAFGVATVEEGALLKDCGVLRDVLTLIWSVDELETAISHGLVLALSNEVQLARIEQLIESGKAKPKDIRLHIALDSGMHRLGFCESELDGVLSRLKSIGVQVEGAYSHLRVRSLRQISAFDRMSAVVREYFPNAIRHLAASHSIPCKRLHYDMVRVGIFAYHGAMRVVSEVVAVRRVVKGEFVSYGNFKLERDTNTAVIFGGYADGVCRERPSDVYIHGRRCRVLGRVCMDMCVVDCGDYLPSVGEEVTLVDSAHIEDIAKQRKSIEYTVMTCWHGRVERIYKDDESRSKTCGKDSGLKDE
ncbi:MAG: alanine racemase [Clostridia bacterium]|nr:alanine racemase [Clostridia bacterium]